MASIPDPIASAKPSGFAPIISITSCGISGIGIGYIVIEIKLPVNAYGLDYIFSSILVCSNK
jgi:hypothetical protein